jgi:hypothetical protein
MYGGVAESMFLKSDERGAREKGEGIIYNML